jgi:hypothetical protein
MSGETRRTFSDLDWVERHAEEQRRRQAEATAKQQATRARNAKLRPPRPRVVLPEKVKPAAFYVPSDLDLSVYPAGWR